MNGLNEFAAFCKDEFWDCPQTQFGQALSLDMHPEDLRWKNLTAFLQEVAPHVGIEEVGTLGENLYVVFDHCGATYPSMVFKVRTSYANHDHLEAALRRDRRDQLELLGIYASLHEEFKHGLEHPAIRLIQLALQEAGFRPSVSGRWDRQTRSALKRWRRRHQLPQVGWITMDDLEALEV